MLNAIVWIIGAVSLFSCIFLIIFQKNKRKDDWKIIVGTGTIGFIWLMYVLSQIFG